jgi:hypothetical protein
LFLKLRNETSQEKGGQGGERPLNFLTRKLKLPSQHLAELQSKANCEQKEKGKEETGRREPCTSDRNCRRSKRVTER